MTDWTGHTAWTGPVDTTAHTGFLLAEDAALKSYLTGLSVPERTGIKAVPVWFRYPEGERRQQFPFITIDLLSAQPSYDRWTSNYALSASSSTGTASFRDAVSGQQIRRGLYQPSVSPQVSAVSGIAYNQDIDNYLMYVLLYQVTVHCRSSLHDRYLMSRFHTDIFPPRPFWIGVDADHTWRRAETLEAIPADVMETTESGSKRIFRKIYTVSMDAEIPQSRIAEIEQVTRIHVDLYGENPILLREGGNHLYDDDHHLAEPINVVPAPEP